MRRTEKQKYSPHEHVQEKERQNGPGPVEQEHDGLDLVFDLGDDAANNVTAQFARCRLERKRMFELYGHVKHVFHVPHIAF